MFGDLAKIMKLMGEMKIRLPELQAKLEAGEFSAEAGSGAVRATVNGKLSLLDVKIDPQALAGLDAPLLEDLVKAAVSAAQQKAAQAAKDAMKELTGGVQLPGLEGLM